VLCKGQSLDVLEFRDRANPGHFRWIERKVSLEDVERFEKLERLEREEDEAVRLIDTRECCGRRLTGQRLTGAHALKWLPPHRSQAIQLSLPGIPLSIGRSACLQPPPTYSCRRKRHAREYLIHERLERIADRGRALRLAPGRCAPASIAAGTTTLARASVAAAVSDRGRACDRELSRQKRARRVRGGVHQMRIADRARSGRGSY
jgi:hypothetical protein